MANARKFFTPDQQKIVTDAIAHAEKQTSGEIMVHIDDKCKEDVLDRAAYVFELLNMHKTELRNGVLFYVAFEDRKFAIIGDAGINSKVEEGFWDSTRDIVIENFKKGEYAEGLAAGVKKAGSELQKYFPYQKDDVNELSNEMSFGSDHDKKNDE